MRGWYDEFAEYLEERAAERRREEWTQMQSRFRRFGKSRWAALFSGPPQHGPMAHFTVHKDGSVSQNVEIHNEESSRYQSVLGDIRVLDVPLPEVAQEILSAADLMQAITDAQVAFEQSKRKVIVSQQTKIRMDGVWMPGNIEVIVSDAVPDDKAYVFDVHALKEALKKAGDEMLYETNAAAFDWGRGRDPEPSTGRASTWAYMPGLIRPPDIWPRLNHYISMDFPEPAPGLMPPRGSSDLTTDGYRIIAEPDGRA